LHEFGILCCAMLASQYIADLEGALHFIGDQIPAATALWVGGHNAKGAIAAASG
jgi:hypothetical protein